MTPDQLKILNEAANTDDSVIVLIVPADRVGDLFPTPSRAGPAFEDDLSVARYRDEYEPDLSESRIRELCAAEAFPDTSGEDGEVVPGAYKNDSGEWRITLEGIVARRQAERRRGLERRRREAARKKQEAMAASSKQGNAGQSGDAPVHDPKRGPRNRAKKTDPLTRPNKGTWRETAKEKRGR